MDFTGKYVIVRCDRAGVHIGTLAKRTGREVALTDSRRIWSWEGAFTLSAIAQKGIKRGRLSTTVPSILLLDAIEIIPTTAEAQKNLSGMKDHTP